MMSILYWFCRGFMYGIIGTGILVVTSRLLVALIS